MQVPGAGLKLFQFSDIGKHCSRFARKKATVHIMIRPIMIHEMIEKVLVKKILSWRFSLPEVPVVGKPICYLR